MAVSLYDYQRDAISRMANGCILCGGVGSGKSRTSIAYYYEKNGGKLDGNMVPMNDPPEDLYIITTAKKRDSLEWEQELIPFLLSSNDEVNLYGNKVVIDSWNNIGKYSEVENSFFIFDEQRVVGKGAWVKSFLKISKKNSWILLSATPGDTWMDYVPVFIANGFYKNRTQFNSEHVQFSRFTKYPKVERYYNTGRLIRLRNRILVNMDFKRQTVNHHEDVYCDYDSVMYKTCIKNRWDFYKDAPIATASELCYSLRHIVNSDVSRIEELEKILRNRNRVIVFYNFDYELDMIKAIPLAEDVEIAEWNGHKHQPIPETDRWLYLVQYNAGSEGWNCIKTNTIVFFSQNYSYKTVKQASGRIDRLNTPYVDLYYYHFKSRSGIDIAINRALSEKRNFNENRFMKGE